MMDNGAGSYRRFLNGDEDAFDEIMQAYFHSLVYFLTRYVQDVSAAEDLAMDAFTELIVHPHRYRFDTSLKTYLFMMGKSRALSYLRRKKLVEFTSVSETQPEDTRELWESVLADQRKQLLHRAIAQLPGDMQIAVHLFWFEGLSYEDTARVMKKKRKQVDNLLYRAKKELRAILGKDGEQWL